MAWARLEEAVQIHLTLSEEEAVALRTLFYYHVGGEGYFQGPLFKISEALGEHVSPADYGLAYVEGEGHPLIRIPVEEV